MSIITGRENLKVFLLDDDFVCIYCFTVHVCEYGAMTSPHLFPSSTGQAACLVR